MTLSKDADVDALGQLQTESRSPLAQTIDSLNTLWLCEAFNNEEALVAHSVAQCLPTIASVIDDLVPRLRAGGRLIYVGAGNSGRVASMDCCELPVTFSADPKQFLAVAAGGSDGIIRALEGAEDCEMDGAMRLEDLEITSNDAVVGISASGRTPFVLGALRVALKHGALTVGVTNAYPSSISKLGVTHCISALVGSEFLTGSTRLKAGSAAKQILNMISTCMMVKLGKTYKGLMIDVRVNNHKLRARGRRIVRQVCGRGPMYILDDDGIPSFKPVEVPDTSDGNTAIDSLIKQCDGSVKLACGVAISGLVPDSVKHQLDLMDGKFSLFAEAVQSQMYMNADDEQYFLAIDGGGTNCTVSIATRCQVVARGTAGACNFNCVASEELVKQIRTATARAVAQMPSECSLRYMPKFTKVWAGLAGLHDARRLETLTHGLESLFRVSARDGSLRLSSDGMLLGSCIGIDDSVDGGVSVIAGTGSVATAFKKLRNGEVVLAGRAGGWGHLLGDQGSAFYIGKRALQTTLRSVEENQGCQNPRLTKFEDGVLTQLKCSQGQLLERILHSDIPPKQQISDLAKVVTRLGLREQDRNPQALAILDSAADCLAQLIGRLVKKDGCGPSTSSLILSGALMQIPAYRARILDACARQHLPSFKKIIVVDDASGSAAQFLAKDVGRV